MLVLMVLFGSLSLGVWVEDSGYMALGAGGFYTELRPLAKKSYF